MYKPTIFEMERVFLLMSTLRLGIIDQFAAVLRVSEVILWFLVTDKLWLGVDRVPGSEMKIGFLEFWYSES